MRSRSSQAARVLPRIRRERSPKDATWLFPAKDGGHRKDIKDTWAGICRDAGIKARAHDLRHTYASTLASAGQNLPIIGALLGHTTPATTQRYSHLFDDPLRKAADQAGAILKRNAERGNRAAQRRAEMTRYGPEYAVRLCRIIGHRQPLIERLRDPAGRRTPHEMEYLAEVLDKPNHKWPTPDR